MHIKIEPHMKASALFAKLKSENIPLSEKVELVLRHYGWTGEPRKESEQILSQMRAEGYTLFPSAVALIEQFYRLYFPCKSSDSKYGAHLIFVIDPYVEADEALSIHYNEVCVPIGELQTFDLYSDSVSPDTWENVNECPAGYGRIELYLGESGTVYWYCVDAPAGGIQAKSLQDFFASQFGLIEDTYLKDGTREEYEDDALILEIEMKRADGTYLGKWHMQSDNSMKQ